LDTEPCLEALEEALAKDGRPDISKGAQSRQFTRNNFTGILKDKGIQINMDGKRPWMDKA